MKIQKVSLWHNLYFSPSGKCMEMALYTKQFEAFDVLMMIITEMAGHTVLGDTLLDEPPVLIKSSSHSVYCVANIIQS